MAGLAVSQASFLPNNPEIKVTGAVIYRSLSRIMWKNERYSRYVVCNCPWGSISTGRHLDGCAVGLTNCHKTFSAGKMGCHGQVQTRFKVQVQVSGLLRHSLNVAAQAQLVTYAVDGFY
jgi:hypothetical protein